MSAESENVRTNSVTERPALGQVVVRYWAAARAAAGVESDTLSVAGPVSLAEVRQLVAARHRDSRLADVLKVCAVLVGDAPVASAEPATVIIAAGSTVEFLPPFAGG
ncbi:MAG: MoaD/ThiS family protein [Nocardioides sp.]